MTLTVKFLNEMFRIWGDKIDQPLEEYLLAIYEEEPFPEEWSEHDLYEQIRKLILQYEQGELEITVPSVEERWKSRYEALKDCYIQLWHESNDLKDVIENAKKMLGKSCYVSSDNDNF
jgi:hypothetical protein